MQNKRDDNSGLSHYNFFPKNRKGQDISITTIILVVLGIAVLVLLILGFTKGWGNIAPWLSGNNVESIRTQCQASCATNSEYGFCTNIKSVNNGTTYTATCYQLANGKEKNADTIETMSYYKDFGITTCSTITCPNTQ
ncbi:MAG: hypothetical protein AABW47_02450 [Nanoarchaeota archaeon]